MSDVWRIFVVEGEEALNRSLVNSLHKDGYVVQGVTNGADAVRVLWMEEYDVVICDLKTPGADGFELLQWLRAYRPNTRMIMVGSGESTAQRLQALESGAVSYLEKPLDFRVLKDELRRLLQQTGFTASLDSFDLLDVIQIITMSRKSITLLLNTGLEERGTLRFQNGELIWAEYGILRGEEAFFALAAHKNGTVTQQSWNDEQQAGSNVTQPLSRLIFQALQYRTKYADRLQYSGEISVIAEPKAPVPDVDDLDDRPFIFFEDELTQQSPGSVAPLPFQSAQRQELPQPFQQPQRQVPPLSPPTPRQEVPLAYPQPPRQSPPEPFQTSPGLQPVPLTGVPDFKTAGADSNDTREWWERTGQMISMGSTAPAQSAHDLTVPPALAFDEQAFQNAVFPLQEQDPATAQQIELPSWLTDQPTSSGFPKVRTSSLSGIENLPTPRPSSSSEWQSPLSLSQGFESPAQPASRTASLPQPSPIRETPPVVPPTPDLLRKEPVSQLSPHYEHPYEEHPHLHLTAVPDGPLSLADPQDSNPMLSSATLTAQKAARRNYTALVSALQTLGYSIAGFTAAAVVSIDGQPIAQVAVDDLDIAKLCKYFSTIQKHILLVLEQGDWGEYEDTIISSKAAHILVRMVGTDKKAFQVLITTREAHPAESLEVMANVEGAISAALR